MATTTAARTKPVDSGLKVFIWEGKDKRGVVMRGEQLAKSDAILKAELRRQGIQPISVKEKTRPLFGGGGKRVTPRDIAFLAGRSRR